MTGGAVNPMLARGTRQPQDILADRAGAIHVRLAIAEPVAKQLKEAAKPLVFPSALVNISGEDPKEDPNHKRHADRKVGNVEDQTC